MILNLKKAALMIVMALPLIFLASCGESLEEQREDFLATYDVLETCTSGNYSYEIVITQSSTSEDGILISNLWDWSGSIDATIDGNELTFTSQVVNGITISGTGSLDEDELTLNYDVLATEGNDACIATCTKK